MIMSDASDFGEWDVCRVLYVQFPNGWQAIIWNENQV